MSEPITCPRGDSDARREFFSSAETVPALPTRLSLTDWLREEGITLSAEYADLIRRAQEADEGDWKLNRFLNIPTSDRPILGDNDGDLALRRWSESRNAAIIEDFLLAHGEEILTEIGGLSCMGIRKEVTDKGDIVSYFSDFGDKKFSENSFQIAGFQNDIVDIIQSKFRSFLIHKLTPQEERIMALFGIQPQEGTDSPAEKVMKSFLGGIGQLVADSCRLIGNSVVLYNQKYSQLPLPDDIDTMFRSSFRSQVMESAFGNHSLDQIQRRKDGRRDVVMSSTDTVVRDTSRATCDYLASIEHMQKSPQARLRFKCPFVRGKYTTDFLPQFQDKFLMAVHRNYDGFLPENHELEAFL
ncbi:hypothetical protein KA071_03135 [Candidatus Gracilibacteria bacterium]|nr:hypothetical protein [Candidatus Gracilibacteria bacterium]